MNQLTDNKPVTVNLLVKTRLLPVILFVAVSNIGHAEDFIIDDGVISDPLVPILDPEYDNTGHRLAYETTTQELWVADIDPATGAIFPANGKGTLIDSNLPPLSTTFNGPEWAHGADGTFIVYTKLVNNKLRLAAAREITPGNWYSSLLGKGTNRYSPLGSLDGNPGMAGLVYLVQTASGTVAQAYRFVSDSSSEMFIRGPKSRGARWSEAENTIVTTIVRNNVRQVAIVDTITGDLKQVTTGQSQKSLPIMWYAPEYGDYVIMARLGNQAVGIYQDLGSGWERVHLFGLPSPRPFIHSPEPFVYNNRSYIVAVAADTIEGNDVFPLQPSGPTDIWIAGVDPQAPFFRQVSVTDNEQNRIDPEVVILDGGPAVYYTEMRSTNNIAVIRRALTGL